MKPVFSIIIPVYNREETIAALLTSIFACNLPFPIEVIIINSGSTDRTKEIIQGFDDKRITIIDIKKEEFNHGLTRNLGVKRSSGTYVYFFSGDALVISKDIFTRTLSHFQTYSNSAIVFARQIPYDATPLIQKLETTVYFDDLDVYADKNGIVLQTITKPFISFNEENKMLWYFSSDVAACYRKSFLTAYPFPKTEYGGEDVFAARIVLEKGYLKIYDSRIVVQHSHNYSVLEYIKREKVEMGLVVERLKTKKKIRLFGKIKKIARLKNISPLVKVNYFFELFVFYMVKILILLNLKIEKIIYFCKKNQLWKHIFIFIFFIFLILASIEIALRVYGYWYTSYVRSLYKNITRENKKIKILAVGESSTGGLWIENRSYPIQLREKLNRYYNCSSCAEVDEFDLPGGNSSSTLAKLPEKILEYKPDIVLFMVGFNDSYFYAYNVDIQILEKYFNKNPFVYTYFLKFSDLIDNIRVLRVAKLIYTNSTLSKSTLLDLSETFRKQGGVSQARFDFGNKHREFIEKQTQKNIEKMVATARVNKAIPILMTYHSGWVNERIREAAKNTNTLLIDNEAVFRKVDNYAEYIFQRDRWHPNEKGYNLIAENILRHLIFSNLLPK